MTTKKQRTKPRDRHSLILAYLLAIAAVLTSLGGLASLLDALS
ncbi:hypothetical protein ACQPYA_01000 [Micromonospora sp. CA-263727]